MEKLEQTTRAEMIGERLKELRGTRTQLDVAQAIGVTPMAISQYERGERIPNDEIKIKISTYFSRSVDELFFFNTSNQNDYLTETSDYEVRGS